MTPLKTYLERADELAQEVIDAWNAFRRRVQSLQVSQGGALQISPDRCTATFPVVYSTKVFLNEANYRNDSA